MLKKIIDFNLIFFGHSIMLDLVTFEVTGIRFGNLIFVRVYQRDQLGRIHIKTQTYEWTTSS
jgi:hypothetical protein